MFHGRTLVVVLLFFSMGSWANEYKSVPGEYVVKLKSGRKALSTVQLQEQLGGQIKKYLSPESKAIVVKRASIEKRDYAIESLQSHDIVELAEPNYIYTINARPNDPTLGDLWGLINTSQTIDGLVGRAGVDISAERAWDIETGNPNLIIGSIDTGVDYTNPDMAPNMWMNTAEKYGSPGVDDDGNGYVDDIYGWDFADGDEDPMDDHGHGTHTSSTMAAAGNDGNGIVGVAWKAKVMALRFLNKKGEGTLEGAIGAIDYAIKMKATLTNNSWGGGPFAQTLYDAVERARNAGQLFVAAAGNQGENNDDIPNYPSNFDLDNVIAVAAINNQGQLAEWSCYGLETVDIAAPGVQILSNLPEGKTAWWDGTSMASPHVAGVAALLYSYEPSLNYQQVRERILKTARPLVGLRGKVATGGMVNAYYALTNTPAPIDENDPYNWVKKAESTSSPHPYTDKFAQTYTIRVPGAKEVSVHFSKFDTEMSYDVVVFKNAQGQKFGKMSGYHDNEYSPIVPGDTIVLEFTTDETVPGYGFDVDAIAYK